MADRFVSWFDKLPRRELEDITTIVLHATEIPQLDAAWDYAEHSAGEDPVGVCGHLYIDRDGSWSWFVPIDRIANHARGHNKHSVGIELVNNGRYPDHFDSRNQEPRDPFPARQLASLKRALTELRLACPNVRLLVRHSDIDQATRPSSNDRTQRVRRRIDPGPQFPWEEIKSGWDAAS